MSTSQLSTQSAVARRSAEAQLRTLGDKFAPAHLRLIGAMRRWLRKRLPTAHEVVYEYRDCFVISYSPSGREYEGVLALRGSADASCLRPESPRPESVPPNSGGGVGRAKRIDSKPAGPHDARPAGFLVVGVLVPADD